MTKRKIKKDMFSCIEEKKDEKSDNKKVFDILNDDDRLAFDDLCEDWFKNSEIAIYKNKEKE